MNEGCLGGIRIDADGAMGPKTEEALPGEARRRRGKQNKEDEANRGAITGIFS